MAMRGRDGAMLGGVRRGARAARGRAGLLAVLLLAPAGTGPGTADEKLRAEPRRPNVLIIVTDDQRTAGSMHVMPKTLAHFSKQGTTFTDAFATTPTCCPSRASIFTGRYAHNHDVHTSGPGEAYLLDQTTTLQRYLSEAGYLTGLFGKYLNEWATTDPPPYFDRWASYGGIRQKGAYKGGRWNVNGDPRRIDSYSTYFIGRSAERFISWTERQDERPWLLFLTPNAPHSPSEPARRHRGTKVGPFEINAAIEEEDVGDKPAHVAEGRVSMRKVKERRRKQLRTLMSVDDIVAPLFNKLKESGELDNTLAIFLSDNGFMWGEHGLINKRYPYLDSVSIPFYLRWPGHVEAGAVDDRLVATIDIAPTVFEAAGIEPEHALDGRSLLGRDHRRERLLLEHWTRTDRDTPDWASFVTETSQYVEYYLTDRFVVTFREYYDLVTDPWQNLNLFGDDDPTNDPDVTATSLDLVRAINCEGTEGPNPCP